MMNINEMLVAIGESPSEILFTTENCARWTDKGVGEASVYCTLMLSYIAAKASQLNLGVNVSTCQSQRLAIVWFSLWLRTK
jgi:hypothetical protein